MTLTTALATFLIAFKAARRISSDLCNFQFRFDPFKTFGDDIFSKLDGCITDAFDEFFEAVDDLIDDFDCVQYLLEQTAEDPLVSSFSSSYFPCQSCVGLCVLLLWPSFQQIDGIGFFLSDFKRVIAIAFCFFGISIVLLLDCPSRHQSDTRLCLFDVCHRLSECRLLFFSAFFSSCSTTLPQR